MRGGRLRRRVALGALATLLGLERPSLAAQSVVGLDGRAVLFLSTLD